MIPCIVVAFCFPDFFGDFFLLNSLLWTSQRNAKKCTNMSSTSVFNCFRQKIQKKAKFSTTTLSVSLSMHCFAFCAFLLSNTVAVGCFEINPLGYVPKHVFIFIKITYCIWIYFIHNTAKTFFFVLLRVNTNCQFSQAQRNLRISRK